LDKSDKQIPMWEMMFKFLLILCDVSCYTGS
jgi:hypothetical protein